MSLSSSILNPFDQVMRKNKRSSINLDFPSLNRNKMMWFRDENVEIGDSICSILTIFQPLADPRDRDLVELRLDVDDPTVLCHVYPTVPTFMYQDYEQMHSLEKSVQNPEIFTQTRNNHKKHALRISQNKHLKLEMSEYQLPFAVSLKSFDNIHNSGSSIMKHYQTIEVDVAPGIKQKRAFLWWKVMIEELNTGQALENDLVSA